MDNLVLDRPQPQTPDAERAVLGAMLITNKAYWRVATIIGAEDFFRDAHRLIYLTICELVTAGGVADLLTVKHALGDDGVAKVGGSAYISSLVDGIPDIANVERYAQLVARDAKLRRLIMTGNAIMRGALDDTTEPEVIAANAIAALTNTAMNQSAQAEHISRVLKTAFDEAQARMDHDQSLALTTGFAELDSYQAIGRSFAVVGSPASHGKTAFIVNLVRGLAEHGHSCVMFSLESTRVEVGWRYVSAESGVTHSRIRDWRRLGPDDMGRIAEAQKAASKRPIYITRSIRTVEDIYAECRRIKTVHGLDAATIDYLQLVRFTGGPRDREERIAAISQRLLEMALDLDIAVVATSQVNKDRLERDNRRLYAQDLKYAAAIGESARVVLMFQRPHVDHPEQPPCKVVFQIAKNNEGRTGDYEMHFDERTQRFAEGTCEQNNCHAAVSVTPKDSTLWQ